MGIHRGPRAGPALHSASAHRRPVGREHLVVGAAEPVEFRPKINRVERRVGVTVFGGK